MVVDNFASCWTFIWSTFMALLTIPAIGFLYYFKNYKVVTVKNFIIANVVVVSVLLFIFKLLLPLTMALLKTEIFTVNSLGMPFNSGTILVAILFCVFYFGLKYTRKRICILQHNYTLYTIPNRVFNLDDVTCSC
jgi:hypothetical protein